MYFERHDIHLFFCEENPAKFLCKTCPGHLCENCKTEHKKKKKTRNHEILSLISNNEGMVDLLYCTEHTKKKLEYNVTATVVKNQSVQIASYNLIMDISWNRCPPFTKE